MSWWQFLAFDASGLRKHNSCRSAQRVAWSTSDHTTRRHPTDLLSSEVRSCTPRPRLVTSSGKHSIINGSAHFTLPAWYYTTVLVCQMVWPTQILDVTLIIKHGGPCHPAIEALNDWWLCVSSRTARVWNSLPPFISSSPSLPVFKLRLKTALFTRSYPAAEYWTNLCLIKLAHVIRFIFVTWPWSSSDCSFIIITITNEC